MFQSHLSLWQSASHPVLVQLGKTGLRTTNLPRGLKATNVPACAPPFLTGSWYRAWLCELQKFSFPPAGDAVSCLKRVESGVFPLGPRWQLPPGRRPDGFSENNSCLSLPTAVSQGGRQGGAGMEGWQGPGGERLVSAGAGGCMFVSLFYRVPCFSFRTCTNAEVKVTQKEQQRGNLLSTTWKTSHCGPSPVTCHFPSWCFWSNVNQ